MSAYSRNDLLDTVFAVVRMDVIFVASVAALLVAGILFKFRDGRAVGTHSRPDLSTVPGEYLVKLALLELVLAAALLVNFYFHFII